MASGPRQRRGQTTPRQSAQRGSRPDPVITNFDQTPWGTVLNKDPRFDYHFWPEGAGPGSLSYAREKGWQIVEAPSAADPSATRVMGGMTAKPGEALRGIHGQVLCKRPIEWGQHETSRKRQFWGGIEKRLGHPSPKEHREFHGAAMRSGQSVSGQSFSGTPVSDQYVSDVGVQSTQETIIGDDPYPAFQEQA